MKKLLISGENAEFQIIESLKTNRNKRCKNKEIFIEGIESIKQAVKAGLLITRIIVTQKLSSWAKNTIEQLGASDDSRTGGDLELIEMSESLYKKLCDRSEPSEMLVTAQMPVLTLDSIALPQKPFILVLDRPSDTGNLGSIIRSANAFGVDAVLLMGHGVDPWDPKTIRASMGSVFFTVPVQLESFDQLDDLIGSQKSRNGITVYGTDSNGELPLGPGLFKRPLMLILGNEAKGLSVALQELCDKIISIPMKGTVNSLNIASAASILMWEVVKNVECGV